MCLLEALLKSQLPKASHYKRAKEMRKGNIAAHGCKIYIEKDLITLSTKTVHRIDNCIVVKPRYCVAFFKNSSFLKIDNFDIFPIYLSSTKLLRTIGRFRVIRVA